MDRRATPSQDEVRRHNLGTLLRLLHVHGAASRASLTAATGLNRSTVRALVTELVDLGLVRESLPIGTGAAGRPSIMVEPASADVCVLAVDVRVEHLSAARVGIGGVVLDRRDLGRTRGDQDVETMVRRVADLVTDLLATAPAGTAFLGIGVAVPGLVASAEGTVRSAPNLGWIDVPLGRLLSAQLGRSLPVSVGNEADLGAMAEQIRGAAAGMSDVVYIAGEVGIGGGIIVGGRPLMGTGGFGGEIGHMTVNPGGTICGCGARGCWETEIGEHAILEATGSSPGTTVEQVRVAFDAGDRSAHTGLRRVGHWLGIGVVNLVNIFNPEVVIFGGRSRQVFAAAEPFVRETMRSALTAPLEQVRIVLSGLGAESSLLGAAELVFGPVLADPAEIVGRVRER